MSQKNSRSTAPDGGFWPWMSVFSCFMGNMIGDGVMYSFGLLIPTFKVHFGVGSGEVVAVYSIQMGLSLTCGPLVSFITNRLGWRLTTAIGSILMAVGLAASAIAPNLMCLYLSGGVCLGLGLGTTLLPRMDCITQNFDRLRPFVTGVAKSGSGVGTIIFAPLTLWLVNTVGWKNALFILSGICVLNCFLGLMFKPLPKNNRKENNNEVSQNKIDQEPTEVNNETAKEMIFLLTNGIFMMFATSNFLTRLGYAIPYTFLPDNARMHGLSLEQGSYLVALIGITNTISRVIIGCLCQFVNIHFFYNTCLVVCGLSIALCNHLQPMFLSIMGSNCTSLMVGSMLDGNTNCTELIPVVDNSTLGLLNQQIIGTQDWFCNPWVGQIISACLYGVTSAAYMILSSLIVADLLGAEKFANGFGLLLLFQGTATLIGPPVVGFMFDSSCSYSNGFMLMGIIISISGFMLYPIPCILKKLGSHERDKVIKNLNISVIPSSTHL